MLRMASFHRDHSHFDYQKLRALDPDYIIDSFAHRSSQATTEISIGLINALGWCVFCIPILLTSWHLSNRGTQHLSVSIGIAVLALAGSFSEMLAAVLYLGVSNTIEWVSSSFELKDWTGAGDTVGYRTVEVVSVILRGLLLWVDAMEWLFLCGIFVLLFKLVRATTRASSMEENSLWSSQWAMLGLCIGILSLVDFYANVLRFASWRVFSRIAFYVSMSMRLVLMPIWLLWLGRILHSVTMKGEDGTAASPEAELTLRESPAEIEDGEII